MSYYSVPDCHTRDKSKVVSHLSNYVSKKELKDAKGVDTSNLAVENSFIALTA